MDRTLRNSGKGNFGLALLEMELGLLDPQKQADRKVSSKERWSALQVAHSNLWGHHSGLTYLSALLKQAKSEIASDGHISDTIAKKIFGAFCLSDHLFALACLSASPPKGKMGDQQSEKIVDPKTDGQRAAVVAWIDLQLERTSAFEECATEREDLAVDAEARSFSLPPADATDKLLRYEAHLDRQLYRAMDQLERLQRQRRGEAVLPPLNINLGRGR